MINLRELLEGLPGWGPYRRKEMRREIDERLRKETSATLELLRHRLTEVQKQVLRSPGGLHWMNALEALHSRLILLSDKLRTAARGYRPLLDLESADEAALQRLWEFDRELARRVSNLAGLVQRVTEAVHTSPQALETTLQQLQSELDNLVETLEIRDRLLRHPEARPPEAPSA